MVSGDTSAKLGGILAIVALMNADVCNTGTRISRCVIFSLDPIQFFGYNLILILGSNPNLRIQSRFGDPILILGSNPGLGIQFRSWDPIQIFEFQQAQCQGCFYIHFQFTFSSSILLYSLIK